MRPDIFILISKRLSDSDLATYLESSGRLDTIQTTKCIDSCSIIYGNASECITGLDGIPSHRFSLSILLLIIFFILHFIFEVLLVVTVDIEIFLFQNEQAVTEKPLLKVDKPLRIKCKTIISGLKIKMRPS